MSSKSKLIIGIVILALGAGLIPTGFLTNDYLRDEVYDGVPEAMLKIKADAIPPLMEQLPALATPEILKGVFDEATTQVEQMVIVEATPSVLLGLRDEINASIPNMINMVTIAQGITYAVTSLNGSQGWVDGTDTFFNDPTYIDTTIWLPGIAMIVTNLSYTFTARQRLLVDGIYSGTLSDYGLTYNTIPGWITTAESGSGVNRFYVTMGEAWWWKYMLPFPGPYPEPMAALVAAYNATESQLLSLPASAYMDYLIGAWVPGAFAASFGMPVSEAIATGFYKQWANGTFIPSGVDLGGYKGYEAGVPAPTNISLATSMALWDSSNPLSFTNDSGIYIWAGAMQGDPTALGYLAAFGLTPAQLTMVLSWLGAFMTNIVPGAFLASQGKTVTRFATEGVFEQWGNGTIFGVPEIPGGFLAEIDASFAGAPYFELGLPTESGLSPTQVESLWDPLNDKTFIYGPSFKDIWLPALEGDTASIAELIFAHSLSAGELTDILTWLGAFIGVDPTTGRSAQLLEYEYGQTLTQIATMAFYEQWANGTINGEEFLPEGFLSRRSPPIYGPPYFEIGLMYSAYLSTPQTLALWDTESEYSLLTVSGVNKWYKAAPGNTIYTTLQTQNGGLDSIQMSAILAWLPIFRDVIVNKLAKDDRNLPMKPYELGETLVLSLGIGGGALAALGVVMLILSRRT